MSKAGKSKMNMWVILVVVVVAAYFLVPSFQGWVKDTLNIGGSTPVTPGTGNTVTPGVCIYDGSTLTLGPAKKRYAPSTSVTTTYHRLYVNGVNLGLKADSSTYSVTPGDSIEVVYAENSSTYYNADHKFTAPCKKTFASADADIDPTGLANIVAVDGPTITIFNYDDGLTNAEATNDTVGTGATSVPRVRITFNAKAGYSPYGELALVALYNNSVWDGEEFSASSSDVTLTECSVPLIASNERSTTGYSLKAWCFPGVEGDASKIVEIYPSFNADDTNAATDITLYLYDQSYYMHSVTEDIEFGWQNNLDADVGDTSEATATYNVGA